MIFYLIGVDYKRAPIDARETLYHKRKEINEFLASADFKGARILYTCNRIELYGVAGDLSEADALIKLFCRRFIEFSRYGYVALGEEHVFRHLLRLASGLESQVKGEPQILQQLYAWHLQERFSDSLSDMVGKALLSAGDIRIRSGLQRPKNNIATLVSRDLKRRIEHSKLPEVVIVGTGKVAELFAAHNGHNFHLYFAGHKNYLKAEELSRRSQGAALALKDLPQMLFKIDALISASSSPHFLFDKDYFRAVLNQRDKPLYLYDLAVPRDINPDVNNLKGIVLNNPDTLTDIFGENDKILRPNLLLAEHMTEEAVKDYKDISNEENYKIRDTAEPISIKTS